MIPKIIHYCWFGHNPKSELAEKCIISWKEKCPDYRIVEWNEDNYCIESAPLYVREAYQEKKWAFVSDYARLQIIYENGGIYLDTDVEVLKNFDSLLKNKAFFGFEENDYIATGLGFGAEKGADILLRIMDDYTHIPFIQKDGSYDLLPCPVRNTECLQKYGLILNNKKQTIDGTVFLPKVYLSPMKAGRITRKTLSIHHYAASWCSPESRENIHLSVEEFLLPTYVKCINKLKTTFRGIIGFDNYETLKNIFKKEQKK